MRWLLVERKPDVVYAGRRAVYLGLNDEETSDPATALTFQTREAAEAHRRHLKRPYDWVTTTAGS
ncbi:hypothetical protein [Hyphomicrobium sp.]|uniref:hypothetical protein n=1 Tax=Hyphomicrobium sp. TaxID=82 RepID=UPI001D3ABF68|nr:hypothetical protein [Hyphomicrobium sp.]MBY0559488.1 hypothetical protein [Hyphomicrobium sp.]